MSDYEGVEDTLFIPLTARVNISKMFPEYFHDKKALELENLVKYNRIGKKSSQYTMMASVARSYNLDQMAQEYIDKHDKCNIVNLGVGLETSYFRINRKNSHYFEVDYFYIENPKEFAKKAECQLIECRGFYKDALEMLSKKLSLYTKISMKIADKRNNAMILHLKL